MNTFKSQWIACFVGALTVWLAAGAASAQQQGDAIKAQALPPALIGIVNVEVALEESKAVQSVRKQMTDISAQYKKEIEAEANDLRTAEQELLQQRTILAPEAFAQRSEEFRQRVAAHQQKERSLRQAMDQGFKDTMQRIQRVLFDEVAKLAGELGYNMVLPSSQIIVSVAEYNITPQAIERLNVRLPDVQLTLEEKQPESGQGKPAAPKR